MDDEPIKVEIPITAGLIKDGINTIYNPAENNRAKFYKVGIWLICQPTTCIVP